MKDVEKELLLRAEHVPEEILKVVSRSHTEQTPGIPFAWRMSYSGAGARQNIRFFENGHRHCKLEFPIRVFFSNFTDAIVVTFVPLEAIREAHILEHFSTFYEVPVEEAKARLDEFPNFPYDGRNADLVRAEILAGGGPMDLLRKSKQMLAQMGIEMMRSW
jgi:hypothetical protein